MNASVTVGIRPIAPGLLRWWKLHGRKDLPWQHDPSPYRVWVSEIMLQQTQVSTVERYYDRFMDSFPDVAALAVASQDAVLHRWSGLGYYSRARNLHRAARIIHDSSGGVLPEDFDELISLPGIGRSTAGAILALASNRRFPILDGNARRVLARVHRVEGWPGAGPASKRLWDLADQETPARAVNAYTQAIMDLGATVCTRHHPSCDVCPLNDQCTAFNAGVVNQIPAARPRRDKPRRSTVLAMAVLDGEVLLEKRAASGIWGGLWSFPELQNTDAIESWCQDRFGASAATSVEIRTWPVYQHSFSHFDLDMTPVEIRLERVDARVMEGDRWLWYNVRAPAEVGLAAPVTKLLQAFGDRT